MPGDYRNQSVAMQTGIYLQGGALHKLCHRSLYVLYWARLKVTLLPVSNALKNNISRDLWGVISARAQYSWVRSMRPTLQGREAAHIRLRLQPPTQHWA